MLKNVKRYDTTISGEETRICSFEFNTDSTSAKRPKSIHYVDIIDRSGSMYRQIDTVIDHTQNRIKSMRVTDFITVIWFSSKGQYEVFLKGASPTQPIVKLLDNIRSVLNLTCFSDALMAATKCVDDIKSIADESIVTLLTDGHPVTSDNAREMRLCQSIVEDMSSKVLAFNTIGFGNYYNRKFLMDLSACTSFGSLKHINDIRKYNDVYLEMTEPITGLVKDHVEILANGKEILYFGEEANGNMAIAMADHRLDLKSISAGRNLVFIVDPKSAPMISINGMTSDVLMPLEKTKIKDNEDFQTFLYMYASYLYNQKNKREVALDIIVKNLKDRAVAELQVNAFTYDEIGEFNELLNRCIRDKNERWSFGICPANFIPKFDAYCIFDLLEELQEGEALYIPYPSNNKWVTEYSRITRKTTDEQDIFKPVELATVMSPISSIVYSEDKLNVSMKFEIPGIATLNKKAADRVGLDMEQKVKIFRNHTIVKDGNLNMPAICINSNEYLKNKLLSRGSFVLDVVDNDDKTFTYTLLLKKLPIINRTYLKKANADDIARNTALMNHLEIDQKVLGYIYDELRDRIPSSEKVGEFKKLTVAQIEVLKDHGISSGMIYSGIAPSVAPAGDSDFYEIRKISTNVAGFSSIPSVSSALKKRKTPGEKYVADHFDAVCGRLKPIIENPTAKGIQTIKEHIAAARKQLNLLRNAMSGMKLSVVLNNSWFEGVSIDEKGKAQLPDNVVMTVKYGKEYY